MSGIIRRDIIPYENTKLPPANMAVFQQARTATWTPSLLLISILLTGCAGASNPADSTDSSTFFQPPSEKLADYNPSEVPHDTVYTPSELSTRPDPVGGAEAQLRKVDYPREAKRREIEGEVWLGFIVSPTGTPTKVQVITPVHPLLDRAAWKAVSDMNFNPGKMDGSPVPVKVAIPVTFNLYTSRLQ